MLFKISINGESPLIMHSLEGSLDSRSPANIEKAEITKRRNKTETDEQRLEFLECLTSLWLDENKMPTVPPEALRGCIENGARKLKDGPKVREGLIVLETNSFEWDKKVLGKTLDEICNKAGFTTPVKVQMARIMRTRAKFDTWKAVFTVEYDPELIDKAQLEQWLDIAGRRVGIGDWTPRKSGQYGRFSAKVVTVK